MDSQKQNKTQKLFSGGARTPVEPVDPQLETAKFVSKVLGEVLSLEQMNEVVMNGQDPKEILTRSQRRDITERVFSAILSKDQYTKAMTKNISMASLSPIQQQLFADLSAGHAVGKHLSYNQFHNFVDGNKTTKIGADQFIKLRPLIGVPGDRPNSFYESKIKTNMSKYYMNLGRFMDAPALDYVKSPTNRRGLLGGGSQLSMFKDQINSMMSY